MRRIAIFLILSYCLMNWLSISNNEESREWIGSVKFVVDISNKNLFTEISSDKIFAKTFIIRCHLELTQQSYLDSQKFGKASYFYYIQEEQVRGKINIVCQIGTNCFIFCNTYWGKRWERTRSRGWRWMIDGKSLMIASWSCGFAWQPVVLASRKLLN